MNQNSEPATGSTSLYRSAKRSATICAAFGLIVFGLLVVNTVANRTSDLVTPARLHAMELELNRNPKDEALKQRIRKLDLQVRRSFFRGQAFAGLGFLLLAGAAVGFFAFSELAARQVRRLPAPNAEAAREIEASLPGGRRAVAVLGALLGGTLMTMAVLSRHDAAAEYARLALRKPFIRQAEGAPPGGGLGPLGRAGALPVAGAPGVSGAGQPLGIATPQGGTLIQPIVAAPGGEGVTPVPPAAGPSLLKDPPVTITGVAPGGAATWPRFRGPNGDGTAGPGDYPTEWNATNGANTLWKQPLALPGWNSPLVVDGKVVLAGATAAKRAVSSFDAATGKPLWQTEVPPSRPSEEVKVMDDTGYAPSTMASDGARLYAVFVNGDVVALDLQGKQLWLHPLGMPENHYGHGASLTTYGTGVIVQFDQGTSASDNKSELLALDGTSGKVVWRIKRPSPGTWSTPIVVKAGKRDLIVCSGNPLLMAYDAASGAEVWRAEVVGGEIAPTPTFGEGFIFVANQGGNLAAVRPDGTGNVTKTAVAWLAADGLPDIVSPLYANGCIYLCTTEGLVTCVDAKTGKKVWDHDFEVMMRTSPTLVGGAFWLFDVKGAAYLVEAGRSFKLVSQAVVGEEVNASPAAVDGRFFVRSKSHLYCFGKRP